MTNEETLEAIREVRSGKRLETLDPDHLKDIVDKL